MRTFFTIIERKCTHEGESYDNSNIWRKRGRKSYKIDMGFMQPVSRPNHEKIILFKLQMVHGSYQGRNWRRWKSPWSLKRELIEELGLLLKSAPIMNKRIYFYSSHRDTYYYNPAYLYEATSYQEIQTLEDFNHLAWFPIDSYINLKRGSHNKDWSLENNIKI